MNATISHLVLLLLTASLAACSGQKPTNVVDNLSAKQTIRPGRNMGQIPTTPKLPGQWTVEDVLQDYGAYAVRKLSPYFAKAKVAYPPSEVIFVALKEEKKLELWARNGGDFNFVRDYDIQAASGVAGPKLRQGDRQVPEGVYHIVTLNPNSHYHLSMKLNYPNEFDRYHADLEGRYDPGSDIFIHGKAASIGCLAMGDEAIEELFVLAAQVGKENVKVVIAPHDPRVAPLEVDSVELPEWAPELYANIAKEIQVLSPRLKSAKAGNGDNRRAWSQDDTQRLR